MNSSSETPALPLSIAAVGDSGETDRALYHWCKRLIDLVLASLLLLLLLPLLLLIAVAIKLETAGPVLFVQERVGVRRRAHRGRTRWEIRLFDIYKFRSMFAGADPSLHEQYIRAFVRGRLEAGDGKSAGFKLEQDRRVTRVGRILRRTSLDELPQLFNVLKGEMSLVGPRPVPAYEVAEYAESDAERLTAVPGITGLWQVYGRGHVPFPVMMRMDREYARNQSLWLDLKILAATIPAVLSGRGAK
jgi:lipopolysaccharide/colanic/teichoic acid biosynthesis glycosyltransferase